MDSDGPTKTYSTKNAISNMANCIAFEDFEISDMVARSILSLLLRTASKQDFNHVRRVQASYNIIVVINDANWLVLA